MVYTIDQLYDARWKPVLIKTSGDDTLEYSGEVLDVNSPDDFDDEVEPSIFLRLPTMKQCASE